MCELFVRLRASGPSQQLSVSLCLSLSLSLSLPFLPSSLPLSLFLRRFFMCVSPSFVVVSVPVSIFRRADECRGSAWTDARRVLKNEKEHFDLTDECVPKS